MTTATLNPSQRVRQRTLALVLNATTRLRGTTSPFAWHRA